ncbi:hypothetical protein SPI_01480 [Niveomyces insectorum RCEF 264]|uniref:Arrestin-like N-terminal domain-containing protein n=1 Tax=Niveomyces insectorum RCEF 264 TaxID=1081102 RepID=A0A167YZZ4_9HYPO|nr:hypothetical protein SPI_01480 [Niveomyces insectorum RCEF 264]
MPPTARRGGPKLAIRLASGPGPYAPGEVLHGVVVRTAPLVTSHATVTVSLHGRAKSRIHLLEGADGTVTYHGRFALLAPSAANGLGPTVHEGPLHIAAGGSGGMWPFAIEVPAHPDPDVVAHGQAAQTAQNSSFISLDRAAVVHQALPASFYCKFAGAHSKDGEAFVEYWLEAELHRPHPSGGGSGTTDTVTLPVAVRRQSTPAPIIPSAPRAMPALGTLGTDADNNYASPAGPRCEVISPRLRPGQAHAPLTFKQKAQIRLRSAALPRYAFRLEAALPTLLQLDHPSPLPVRFRVIPDMALTTPDVLASWGDGDGGSDGPMAPPPPVLLTDLKLVLRVHTEALAPTPWAEPSRLANEPETVDLDVSAALAAYLPLVLPTGWVEAAEAAGTAATTAAESTTTMAMTTTTSTATASRPPPAMLVPCSACASARARRTTAAGTGPRPRRTGARRRTTQTGTATGRGPGPPARGQFRDVHGAAVVRVGVEGDAGRGGRDDDGPGHTGRAGAGDERGAGDGGQGAELPGGDGGGRGAARDRRLVQRDN